MNTERETVTIVEFFQVLWAKKLVIIAITAMFSVAGVLFSLSLPNIYMSQIKLYPSEESRGGGLSGIASQFGGIAGLAGLRLPGAEVDKATLALELARSYDFITNFINRREILVDLMAADSWHQQNDTLTYDPEIHDITAGVWLRESDTKPSKPTDWEAFDYFSKNTLRISVDDKTGIITIGMRHISPTIAFKWVNWFVDDINEHLKAKDVEEAIRSKTYLEKELAANSLSSSQQILSTLIEKQVQTLMMANVREEYVFKVLSPAYVPELKAAPSRAVICILFFMSGFILSSIGVVFYSSFKR
ncbi:LPS biosynthesis protein [Alishewanella longhuensis]|uniref:LPS biosynthesis protein n=1 Tax=Alishewanella longhuensis TaxID=1091037 RepID=A0ABQ3KXF5_9ALTE|nr:Wzz/FepE/Etk N-terminal domain-containing protein [Alishewanella longhuensis]GHG68038.1 LPS biosynthesis protein [Alishewanella longhuensis]